MLNNNNHKIPPFIANFDFRSKEEQELDQADTEVSEYDNIDACTVDENTTIDTDIQALSSRKLWQVLRLSRIKGCELNIDFIEEIKQELILRNDYDDVIPWYKPYSTYN